MSEETAVAICGLLEIALESNDVEPDVMGSDLSYWIELDLNGESYHLASPSEVGSFIAEIAGWQ